jgi:hypothetical protein
LPAYRKSRSGALHAGAARGCEVRGAQQQSELLDPDKLHNPAVRQSDIRPPAPQPQFSLSISAKRGIALWRGDVARRHYPHVTGEKMK